MNKTVNVDKIKHIFIVLVLPTKDDIGEKLLKVITIDNPAQPDLRVQELSSPYIIDLLYKCNFHNMYNLLV
jgi:hypothetical protein